MGNTESSLLSGRSWFWKDRIDSRDEETPDGWIIRDPILERLTGNHPLNAEMPLSLVAKGFITEPSQGYVRNHGAVPKIDRDLHQLQVHGLGFASSKTLSMDDIEALPSTQVTVTFACSGNRRKEVNAVKPSIGVPYGPGAVQTCTFTGVPLTVLFEHCAFDREEADHHIKQVAFLNFSSPRNELPRGDYGTSLLLDYALDPANDVSIAYKCNGQPLLPDHGFPLRLVIPGYIGGRMIKWLSSIEVADHESESHYYFHDNRLFPSKVGYEEATKEGWWYRPEYIIGEMNINSAITDPPHRYILPLEGADDQQTLRGFAYSGGGRRVIIFEVSFDHGHTWETAELHDHELGKPNSAGKFWTWRRWSVKLDLSRLLNCKAIKCRAWDSSFNTQPEEISWNVLGMMNNGRYTITIESCRTSEGRLGLTFSHPMPPHDINYDKNFGRPPCEVEDRERPQVPPSPRAGKKGKFTKKQIAKHNKEDDLWLIVIKKVYDVTNFLNDHPGGAGIITTNGGENCEEFDAIHSVHAHKMLQEYYLGDVVEEEEEEQAAAEREGTGEQKEGKAVAVKPEQEKEGGRPPPPSSPSFLDPHHFQACSLIKKEVISHDTRLFRFALPHPHQTLGLPLGQHIYLRAMIKGEMIMRPYTPTSLTEEQGHFDLVVKVYAAGQDPKHPKGGRMSQYLDQMKEGETIDVKGPMGRLVYKGNGWFEIKGKAKHVLRIGMVAGGTGITPMYQLIKAILLHDHCDDDPTHISLIFANKTPEDILLRKEVDQSAKQFPDRFKVWYTVDRVPEDYGTEAWPYDIGYVNADMFDAHLPPPTDDTLILLCGPPPLVHYACRPNLEKLGFSEKMMFDF